MLCILGPDQTTELIVLLRLDRRQIEARATHWIGPSAAPPRASRWHELECEPHRPYDSRNMDAWCHTARCGCALGTKALPETGVAEATVRVLAPCERELPVVSPLQAA